MNGMKSDEMTRNEWMNEGIWITLLVYQAIGPPNMDALKA